MRFLSLLRIMTCAMLIAGPLAAQENRTLFPRFGISAGAYLGEFSTDLRVDPHVEGFEGTTLDFERHLGLDSTQTISRVALQWRPFRRHEVGLAYGRSQRQGRIVIDREIRFEDTVFPIRADIVSDLDVDFWDFAYTYWLVQSERNGVGINLGVSGLIIDARLSLVSQPNNVVLISEGASTEAPIPLVIGLEGRRALTSNLIGIARVSYLPKVSVGEYSGQALVAKGALEYHLFNYLALGVGYNFFEVDGAMDDEDFHADIAMVVSGVDGYVRFVFGGR